MPSRLTRSIKMGHQSSKESPPLGIVPDGDIYECFYSCRQCWASKCRGL
jgi:hypothetical protein